MNISGIGAVGASMGPQTRTDPYQRQIQSLQEKINELKKNDKMDPAQKQTLLEQYNQQLQDLKSQQTQASLNNTLSGDQNQSKKQLVESSDSLEEEWLPAVEKETQKAFIQAGDSKERSQTLSRVRTEKENVRRQAASENFIKQADPVTAKQAADSVAAINRMNIQQSMKATKEIAESKDPRETSPGTQERVAELATEEAATEGLQVSSGTGRMGKGQYVDDHA